MVDAINRFLISYARYFETDLELKGDDVSLASEEDLSRVEGARLRDNVVGIDVIRIYENRLGPLPEAFRSFLMAPSCERSMDVLLMRLPGLSGSEGLSQVDEMLQLCEAGLAPFGLERDGFGLGMYCVDLRDERSFGAVVYCPHPSLEPGRPVSAVLGSSFVAILDVLSWLLTTDVPWSDLSGSEVADLRAIDPEGFGGSAWDSWWRPRVLGTC